MKIELPDSLQAWLQEQAEMHGHATPEAFVANLVERERKRHRQWIEQKLLESLDSGEPIEITPEYWKDLERRVEESVRNRGKAASECRCDYRT